MPVNGRITFALGGGLRRLPLGKTRSTRATDISQGRELTPERGLKNEAPARAYPAQTFPPGAGS